jgi:hypothetical protein
MNLIIIIFLIALIIAFLMLNYRAWEIAKNKIEKPSPHQKVIPEIYFRHIEKIILYLAKYSIQWFVLTVIKVWFIFITKVQNIIQKKLPKIHNLFKKKEINSTKKISSVYRALVELKTKIKRVKEKTIKENIE